VAFLYGPAAPGGGRSDGVLAEGTITAANLVGPLAGHPLSDLIAAMEAGNAYVNVHTNDGVAPPNTGPGDIPGGEVRGQIRATHPRTPPEYRHRRGLRPFTGIGVLPHTTWWAMWGIHGKRAKSFPQLEDYPVQQGQSRAGRPQAPVACPDEPAFL